MLEPVRRFRDLVARPQQHELQLAVPLPELLVRAGVELGRRPQPLVLGLLPQAGVAGVDVALLPARELPVLNDDDARSGARSLL